MIFLNSASSAAALVFYLPGACTHTDTEGKQRKARVLNILKIRKKHNILWTPCSIVYVTMPDKKDIGIVGKMLDWTKFILSRCTCSFHKILKPLFLKRKTTSLNLYEKKNLIWTRHIPSLWDKMKEDRWNSAHFSILSLEETVDTEERNI